MILGRRDHFTKEHYERHAGVAPPELCELVVHCLELVSQLSHSGLEYRFKGGNSLLVLLEDPQRFSIDVDIVTTTTRADLGRIVAEVTEECELFSHHESRAPRTKPWLPLASFKLFFSSVFPRAEPAYVMLDAVLEPPPYAGVKKPVRCGSLYASAEAVEVPTVSGLVGDKLLAIGPSTLGIPLGKGKEAQRLKHVYDVATLCRHDPDLHLVRESLQSCKAQEQRIQGAAYSWEEVLEDTLKFCGVGLAYDEPPRVTADLDPYLQETAKGFDGFRQHLFRIDYTWSLYQRDCRQVCELVEKLGAMAAIRD